ncbi:ABC transporter ATP-binding protein, partial [Candidatus Bathyarchaeota archaeon]
RNPAILILDEATSSIDPYTDLLIRKAMKVLLKDRTSIIIAHRLSTVRDADRILVIDDGRIVEEGSHKELIKKGGLYSHLYEMQFKEPETEALTVSTIAKKDER